MENIQIGTITLGVEHLRGNRYAVGPANFLGTCGFYPYPWTALFLSARSVKAAALKAYPKVRAQIEAHQRCEAFEQVSKPVEGDRPDAPLTYLPIDREFSPS